MKMRKVMVPAKRYASGGAVGNIKPCAGCKNVAMCAKAGRCLAQGMKNGGAVKGKK